MISDFIEVTPLTAENVAKAYRAGWISFDTLLANLKTICETVHIHPKERKLK